MAAKSLVSNFLADGTRSLRKKSRHRKFGLSVVLLMAIFLTWGASAPAQIVINEFVLNHTGPDTHEFVELLGAPNTDYSALTILEVEGDASRGIIDGVFPVGATDSNGYWSTGFMSNVVENGSVTLLLVSGFSGFLGGDLDSNDDGVIDNTPWTALVDGVSVVDGGGGDSAYSTAVLAPGFDGNPFTPGGASRIPDGVDTNTASDWVRNDFDGAGLPGFSGTPDAGEAINTPLAANQAASALGAVIINEFVINHTGTDTHEFVEVLGAPNSDYSAYTILEIEGDVSRGIIDGVFPVGLTDSNGYWSTGFMSNAIENGTVTLLLVRDFSGFQGLRIDTNSDGVIDAIYWTEIVDSVAVTDGGGADSGYSPVILAPGFDGDPFTPGGASRIPDGLDTDSVSDWVRNDFDGAGLPGFPDNPDVGEAINTPGTVNSLVDSGDDFGVCGDTATFIHDIQGVGEASAMAGDIVVVEGVVVGDFQDTAAQLSGFFVQEDDADVDGDPMTSEGIFVFDNGFGVDVSEGDVARVQGEVAEVSGLTTLTNITNVSVCQSGTSVTAAILTLPVFDLADWEMYEGMLLSVPQTMYVSGHFELGRTGEVDLSVDGRLYAPTNVTTPGAPANALEDINDRSRIILDDGSNAVDLTAVPYLGADGTLRAGDTVPGLTGVLDYSSNAFRIQPTAAVSFTRVNERSEAPPSVGGRLKVTGFNVANYFTTIDDGLNDARGADSPEEFLKQREKLVAAILALDADVVGLIEIENNGDTAVGDLVDGLNDASAPGTYDFVSDPVGGMGSDAIKAGIIYRPSAVTPVGPSVADYDPVFNRPPIAQTFMDDAANETFSVVVNHFKSKACAGATGSDLDQGDGQGCYNATRIAQAAELLSFVADLQSASGDEDVLVIGDLNAHGEEDPIFNLEAGGLTNLVDAFVLPDESYSFVFFGQAGQLDHALSTSGLDNQTTGAAIWHVNSDEPRVLDYNDGNPPGLYEANAFRSSDHDPVLIGLDLDTTPPELTVSVSPEQLLVPNHKYVRVEASVEVSDNTDPDVEIVLVSVTSNEPDKGLGDGDTINDIVILGDFTFDLRAERAGRGSGRVYTITYEAIDDHGNKAVASATVIVPKGVNGRRAMRKP